MTGRKKRSYFIKTFGCVANEADSERLAGALNGQGLKRAAGPARADLVIINSCSVREAAENRVFGLINNLRKGPKSNSRIILTGCMVGSAKGQRRRYSLRQLKKRLPLGVEVKNLTELIGSAQARPARKKKKSALVPIMEGCNHFCAYCVVPYARGQEESRSFEEIVAEVEDLARLGYREIVLVGQNVNSYGRDLRVRQKSHRKRGSLFACLLVRLHEIEGVEKISFLTSNPWDFSDEIIEAMVLPKIDRYLHLPVQSGDDLILKKMNRGYTVQEYLDLVRKIKTMVPEIKIGTDIIVGFPGETEEAFANTVKLCREVGFVKAYIARYSPRPGTASARLKDSVPVAVKKERWQILERLINS